jgi:hypothetical protein
MGGARVEVSAAVWRVWRDWIGFLLATGDSRAVLQRFSGFVQEEEGTKRIILWTAQIYVFLVERRKQCSMVNAQIALPSVLHCG